jgi:uncharacterized protein (TIGR02145 family)
MSGKTSIPGLIVLVTTIIGSLLLQSCVKDPVLATLTTGQATDITINSAVISGNITDNGRAEITARGFCWGINPQPTLDDEFVPSGTGSGPFSATVSGLEPNTSYHIRAYAENSVGVAYGNDVLFVTSTAPPTVTTVQVTNISAVTASCGGNVTYDGGAQITSRGVCWSTSPQPDITDFHSSDGTGSGSFPSTMNNLSPATTYYVRAYASNGSWTVYGEEYSFRTKLSDADGNLYNTILIGSQLWMTENLRTSKLNDNTAIPEIQDNAQWVSLTTPEYCWYDNNINFKSTYGALYNWYTVNTGKLCPNGWRVPTDTDFSVLETTLGMAASQAEVWGFRGTDHGLKMKNTSGWDENGNGTNSSGFTALPGGYRYGLDGMFVLQTTITYWWTASEHDADRGWYRRLDSSSDQVYRASTSKKGGKYVRCVKN